MYPTARVSARLAIGGLGLELHQPVPCTAQDSSLTGPFVGHPRAALRLSVAGSPTLPPLPARSVLVHRVLNRREPNWCTYLHRNGTVFDAIEQASGKPDRRYFLSGNRRWCRAFVTPGRSTRAIPLAAKFSFPYLTRPVIEVIWSRLLPARGGLFLHALGLNWQGKGLVFIGRSGAGKSTLASIFDAVPGASILNDDRTILRRTAGTLNVFGTPWSGQFRKCAPGPVPLGAIFAIRHGKRNSARRLSPAEAARSLLLGLLGPRWSAPEAARTSLLCARFAASVPCFELFFVNDARVVDFVRDRIGA